MIQLKLNKNVGKNCYPDPADVMIVQTCLAGIKIRSKFGPKPAWQGKIDGKNSKELVCAIENYQLGEGFKITGKVEAYGGQTWSRLKQKTSAKLTSSNPMIYLATKVAQAAPSFGQKKHYTLDPGVKLTPALEKKMAQIANAYYVIARKDIRITSGTRSPAKQALAMFDNMKKGDRLTVYINQTLAGQIRNAFDTAQAAGQSDQATIAAMEQVIAQQVANGQYISKHLISGAVDVSVQNMSRQDEKIFDAVAKTIAKTVILETVERHFHLQF
jgi:hypothetical protein